LRHFAGLAVAPAGIEKTGISDVELADLQHAVAFGGALRPVVLADWRGNQANAFAGLAFVDGAHPLSRVDGVQNAVLLRSQWAGDLFFSGPGAGPTVTAATILDDVLEARAVQHTPPKPAEAGIVFEHATGWFVRLTADQLSESDAPAVLGTLGVRLRRVSAIHACGGSHRQWLLTAPCTRAHLEAALEVLSARTPCRTWQIRVVE
jgi:hypothetical protein